MLAPSTGFPQRDLRKARANWGQKMPLESANSWKALGKRALQPDFAIWAADSLYYYPGQTRKNLESRQIVPLAAAR
jgi:hypothetical protein